MSDKNLNDFMLERGFSESDIKKILGNQIYNNCNPNDIYESAILVFKCLNDFRFSDEEIKIISKAIPHLLLINISYLHNKLNVLFKRFHFNKEMIVQLPILILMREEVLENKLDIISVFLGYSLEQVEIIVNENPQILTWNDDYLIEKISFYSSTGLKDIFIKDPKCVLQSIELTYARFMFFHSIKFNIDMSNYEELFLEELNFIKKYHISNKQLIEKYPYPIGFFTKKKKK